MKIFTFCLSAFLVLQMTNSLPSPVEEIRAFPDFSNIDSLHGKVRDKRKSDIVVPVADTNIPIPAVLPSKEAVKTVPSEAVKIEKEVIAEDPKKSTVNKSIIPENTPQETIAGRVKKQAIKVPCSSKTVCGLPANIEQQRQNNPELVLVKHNDQPQPSEVNQFMKQSRTVDPIYSFGPVSVNSNAGYGHNTASYGQNYNLAVPARPVLAPSASYSSQASYSSPGGLSYHVVMPYAAPVHHRQPMSQHSFTVSHTPIEIKPVMYYEAPEPILIDAHEDSLHSSHAEDSYAVHDVNPVSLYCQTMKSKDLAKTLTSGVKGKSNDSSDDTLDHIQRVNEIKDEITELNAAAQKLVDQQEKFYRMKQENMALPKQEYMVRSSEPMMMRTHPRMPPYSPYMYPSSYMRPMYREADEVVETSTVADTKKEVEKPKEDVSSKAKEDLPKKSDQQEKERSHPSMRQWFPDYNGYYRSNDYPESDQMRHFRPPFGGYYRNSAEGLPTSGYRTFPGIYGSEYMPYQRSETGFPTAPMFQMRSQPETAYRSEDAQFLKQLLEMGKKMGILSNDYQLAKKSEEKDKEDIATKSENVLDDLTFGQKQKPKDNVDDKPTSIDISPLKNQQDLPPQKKDKRGLIHKNN